MTTLQQQYEDTLRENEQLRALLGPALQDTERLNWLEAHPLRAGIHGGADDGSTGTFWGCGSANLGLRETIDTISAMPSKP